MRLLDAAEVRQALPLDRAVVSMRDAFRAISEQRAAVAERQVLPVPAGSGLLMGAAAVGVGIVGKLVAVMPGNAARGLPGTIGLVMLMDDATGEPLALLDGAALTARRTAAVAACATNLLARPDARRAALAGCGTQAAEQLAGLEAVRPLTEIRVLGRTRDSAGDFVRRHQAGVRARLLVADDPASAAAGADIIVTATNSETPVFALADLPAGCHLCGIGSFRAGMCENPPELAASASVFVESRESAAMEGGELLAAVEQGCTRPADWTEIGEVLAGRKPGRRTDAEITFFKSVGHAVFDLYAARAALDSARERGLGTSVR